MNGRINVLEYSSPQIDAAAGVIIGVKIIGVKSKNGYTYPPAVLRKAKSLYENAPVFVLHPDSREQKNGARNLAAHFGSLQNVRERGVGEQLSGLFGDLHVKLSHPLAAGVLEAAADARFGLSHNAVILMNGDETAATEIIEVNSVDLVDSPATSKNLFESAPAEVDVEQLAELVAAKLEGSLRVTREGGGSGGSAGKQTRLTALEDRTGDPETTAVGNTHEDFVGALRGYPTTNK